VRKSVPHNFNLKKIIITSVSIENDYKKSKIC
jgi:hypothetical protein